MSVPVCGVAPGWKYGCEGVPAWPVDRNAKFCAWRGPSTLPNAVMMLCDWGAGVPMVTRGSNHLRFVMPDGVLRVTTNLPLTYLVGETWFALRDGVSWLCAGLMLLVVVCAI